MEEFTFSHEVIENLILFFESMQESTRQRIDKIDEKLQKSRQEVTIPKEILLLKQNPQIEEIPNVDDCGEGKIKIMTQIKKTINEFFNPEDDSEPKVKRGRPEAVKDCNPLVLKSLLNSWEKELDRRMGKEQRSDAQFATVGRYIKKLPDIFLKYIGSKCQYKSKEIRVVLRTYLKSFLKGFYRMFSCPPHIKLKDLFLDYIILWFPDTKVTAIFDELLEEGSILHEEYEQKIDQLKLRTKASKISYKELVDSNLCFQVIAGRLPEHLKLIRGQNLEKLKNVLTFLLSSKEC